MTNDLTPLDDTPANTQDTDGVIRKPVFFDRVVTRSGMKKRDVKPAVEAALAELAEALVNGEELMLPPLGKLRVVKTKEIGNGAAVVTLKLRTPKTAPDLGSAGPDDSDSDA